MVVRTMAINPISPTMRRPVSGEASNVITPPVPLTPATTFPVGFQNPATTADLRV